MKFFKNFSVITIMLLAIIMVSCEKEKQAQFETLNKDENLSLKQAAKKSTKVQLCHITGNGDYVLIEVSEKAVNAHLAHGDKIVDEDGDGYTAIESCTGSMDDCNDLDASINPGAEEICGDGIDNNCNGYIDEDCANETFTDIRDDQVYNWVKIGNQIWMAENLKYLPEVVGPSTYSKTAPYYYVYDYDGTDVDAAKASDNYATYGVLYNWPAAMAEGSASNAHPSGVQGVCPSGWHLPSVSEWAELTNYLMDNGGSPYIGKSMASTTEWKLYSGANQEIKIGYMQETNNSSGFTGLPGGSFDGLKSPDKFVSLTIAGRWWSTDNGPVWRAYSQDKGLSYQGVTFTQHYDRSDEGMSVRCVKN